MIKLYLLQGRRCSTTRGWRTTLTATMKTKQKLLLDKQPDLDWIDHTKDSRIDTLGMTHKLNDKAVLKTLSYYKKHEKIILLPCKSIFLFRLSCELRALGFKKFRFRVEHKSQVIWSPYYSSSIKNKLSKLF